MDRERCSLDREQTLKAKESIREEIRTLFSFYRPEVPKSRRKKIKVSKGDDAAPILTAPVIETEDSRCRPGNHRSVDVRDRGRERAA